MVLPSREKHVPFSAYVRYEPFLRIVRVARQHRSGSCDFDRVASLEQYCVNDELAQLALMLHCRPALLLEAFCLALCLTSTFASVPLATLVIFVADPPPLDYTFEASPVEYRFTCVNVEDLIPGYPVAIAATLEGATVCRVSELACKAS